MDQKALASLDPKLRETYERVMGTKLPATPSPIASSGAPEGSSPMLPVQPIAADAPHTEEQQSESSSAPAEATPPQQPEVATTATSPAEPEIIELEHTEPQKEEQSKIHLGSAATMEGKENVTLPQPSSSSPETSTEPIKTESAEKTDDKDAEKKEEPSMSFSFNTPEHGKITFPIKTDANTPEPEPKKEETPTPQPEETAAPQPDNPPKPLVDIHQDTAVKPATTPPSAVTFTADATGSTPTAQTHPSPVNKNSILMIVMGIAGVIFLGLYVMFWLQFFAK